MWVYFSAPKVEDEMGSHVIYIYIYIYKVDVFNTNIHAYLIHTLRLCLITVFIFYFKKLVLGI